MAIDWLILEKIQQIFGSGFCDWFMPRITVLGNAGIIWIIIGVAMLIHDLLPDFELHASTQMVAHSLEDVQYLESIGFKRVVLARELTVDEIKYICDNTNN